MITFFRKIRQSLLKQNKVTRYLIYAGGEIMLVMVGILLALAFNEWNTQRKDQEYLSVMLQEIHKDLIADQDLIYGGIEPRLQSAERGVENMRRRLHAGNVDSLAGIYVDYENMNFGFKLTTTSGGYDALKAKGLEIIQNDSLRQTIAEFYEIAIPRSLTFIHGDDEKTEEVISALEDDILTYETYKNKKGQIGFKSFLKDKKLLLSQELFKIVNLKSIRTFQKRSRLEVLKRLYSRITTLIEEELSRRSIPFTSFDATQVKPDF